MSAGDHIHHICHVTQHPEAGMLTLRPNFCDYPQICSVRFNPDDSVTLTSFTRTRDVIVLGRN